jgi:hypothetical protein
MIICPAFSLVPVAAVTGCAIPSRGERRVLREEVRAAGLEGGLIPCLSELECCARTLSTSDMRRYPASLQLHPLPAHHSPQNFFPLPTMSLVRPRKEDLIKIAQEEPAVVPVPNRGTTAQACLFKGRRLNPAAFPDGVFINERRALLTGTCDYRCEYLIPINNIYPLRVLASYSLHPKTYLIPINNIYPKTYLHPTP